MNWLEKLLEKLKTQRDAGYFNLMDHFEQGARAVRGQPRVGPPSKEEADWDAMVRKAREQDQQAPSYRDLLDKMGPQPRLQGPQDFMKYTDTPRDVNQHIDTLNKNYDPAYLNKQQFLQDMVGKREATQPSFYNYPDYKENSIDASGLGLEPSLDYIMRNQKHLPTELLKNMQKQDLDRSLNNNRVGAAMRMPDYNGYLQQRMGIKPTDLDRVPMPEAGRMM